MISLGHKTLARNKPVTFKVGNAVEYIQIINYSSFILKLEFEPLGTLEFPPRHKEDIYVKAVDARGQPLSQAFDGNLIITPQIFQVLDPTIPIDFNPSSQPYAQVGVNAFGIGELDVPKSTALAPLTPFSEFINSTEWGGTANPTIFTTPIPGLCPVIDQIDLELTQATTATIDFAFTLSYTYLGSPLTIGYTYSMQATASTTANIVDHIVYQNNKVIGDQNTQISLGVTTSATIGTHKSTMAIQYHFEYPF